MNTPHTTPHIAHADDARVLSDAEAERVINRVIGFCKKEDELQVQVQSRWFGGQRWARNRAFLTQNVRNVFVRIERKAADASESVVLNQVDDDSLRAACTYVEAQMARRYVPGFVPGLDLELAHPTFASKGIPVWSDVTYNRKATENAQLVAEMTARAEANGMLSAGQIDTAGAHYMGYTRDSWGREARERGHATMAECSTTVRHPKGVGSGWAGASSFDLPRIDLAKLGEVAFDKCLQSMNPVRIEPGRYQTILEPQATASFAIAFFDLFVSRPRAEDPTGITHPFFLGYDAAIDRGRSRLGLQIADRRLSISHDPDNPITGSHVAPGMQKTDFLTNGVLTEIARKYDKYSLPELGRNEVVPFRTTFEMRGSETTTTEEMIASMKRGLLLTRVSDMTPLDRPSALYTGTTRDGLWLIENGKITKAVRNFRWTESPLFIFNNVESIGASVPVMNSWYEQFPFMDGALQRVVPSIVIPTLKINDFSFTSTIDAI